MPCQLSALTVLLVGSTSHLEELEALKGDYYADVRRAAHRAVEKLHSVSEVR